MRVAADARLMTGNPRGMGHYARAMLEPISDNVIALLPRGKEANGFSMRSSGAGFFPWWEQVVMPEQAQRCGATHLFCPNNTGPIGRTGSIHTILVVHDLIFLHSLRELGASPSAYQNLGRVYRRYVVPKAAQHADTLVTVSEYTRNELCERFGLKAERVRVIPNSIDREWFVEKPLLDSQRKPYLLSVSGEAPSKNILGLIRAFAVMRNEGIGRDLTLRIVGVKPQFQSTFRLEATRLGLEKKVHFDGFLTQEQLMEAYRKAWAFVLPSLFEGFGIPLLEAMASGTPVACSNTTSLPGVAGSAAKLFDPRDTRDMAEVMAAVVEPEKSRLEQAQHGLEQAEKFCRESANEKVSQFWRALE